MSLDGAVLDKVLPLLDFSISDGRKKLSCEFQPKHSASKNLIMLFITGANPPPIALGKRTEAGVYSQEVECAVRHKKQDRCRDICRQAVQKLAANRDTPGASMISFSTPAFKGIDERNGGYVYSFKFLMRGNF